MSEDTSTENSGPVVDDETPDPWAKFSDAELVDMHHRANDQITAAKETIASVRASLLVRLREVAKKAHMDKASVSGTLGSVRLDAATGWKPVITDTEAAAAYLLGREDAKAAVFTQITVPAEHAERALASLRMGLGPEADLKVSTTIDERLLSVWRKHVRVRPASVVSIDTASLPADRTVAEYLNEDTGEFDGDLPGIGAERKVSRIVVPKRTTPDQPDTLEEQQ